MHGFFSGKPTTTPELDILETRRQALSLRIKAIEGARAAVSGKDRALGEQREELKAKVRDVGGRIDKILPRVEERRWEEEEEEEMEGVEETPVVDELAADLARIAAARKVVKLDEAIKAAGEEMGRLRREKDEVQGRVNPLNARNETGEMGVFTDEVFDEYIESLCACGRLTLLNHTELWMESAGGGGGEEDICEDLLFGGDDDKPSGGGSWLLRQTLGREKSIGEKIGETIETVVYKAVCKEVMTHVAMGVGALHGLNVLGHGDIRLYAIPNAHVSLPGGRDGGSYASSVMIRASKRRKRGGRGDDAGYFMQREAVTETLLSHCQISAPLLKLFPIALQRALLRNVVTLTTALIGDAAKGFRLRILGHELGLTFNPIDEEGVVGWMMGGQKKGNVRGSEEFEVAVREIARGIKRELRFLDIWYERVLGSGLLRSQIANLIARVVLTLVDDLVGGLKFDLWPTGGGPRVLAGIEYRTMGGEEEGGGRGGRRGTWSDIVIAASWNKPWSWTYSLVEVVLAHWCRVVSYSESVTFDL